MKRYICSAADVQCPCAYGLLPRIADGDGQWRGWWRVPTCIQVFDNPDEAREWVFEGGNSNAEMAPSARSTPAATALRSHAPALDSGVRASLPCCGFARQGG